MAENTKTYWRGIEELTNEPEFVKNAAQEFPEFLPISENSGNDLENQGTHRRDFLKLMGFSLAAVSLAACEAPVRKAIPYLNKPEDIDPTVANWYASSFVDGGDYCSVLVKTREGRPIKIEGNKLSSVTQGGTSARVQASVLSLYDTTRFKGPLAKGKPTTWEDVDAKIAAELSEIAAAGGAIRLVSHSVISPSTKQVIAEFTAKYPSTKHVVYDAVSAYGITKANKTAFGVEAVPSYAFGKASVIVSVGADFLGTWISPVEYSAQFATNRRLAKDKKDMSALYVFESNMSLTGANADFRTPIRPSEEGLVVAALYNSVASAVGQPTFELTGIKNQKNLDAAAKALVAAKGQSLVVSGSNDANVQLLVNGINYLLGNYGTTIDLSTPSYQKQGNDESMAAFVEEVKAGSVSAVFFYGANPVYDYPQGGELKAALPKVRLKVSFADRPDETTFSTFDESDSSKNVSLVDFVCPDSHFLESWSDAEPKKGFYSLIQPTISPIFKTRQVQESLLAWAGVKKDAYSYLKDFWKKNVFTQQSEYLTFQEFWNYSLHDGVFEVGRSIRKGTVTPSTPVAVTFSADLGSAATAVNQTYKSNASGMDVVVYEKIGMGSGSQANNPWLQEFPDPVTRACWDNYIVISQSLASKHGIKVVEGKTVKGKVVAGGKTIEGAVMVQPGLEANTVAVALGYGRKVSGKAAAGVGFDVYPVVSLKNGSLQYAVLGGATFEPSTEVAYVAHVQTHHTVMARETVIQETTLGEYKKDPAASRYMQMITTAEGKVPATELSLWNKHERPNHAWGLVIDLNTCTGCGSCVIGCQAENNVPVVGKQEVLNRREMHWIRIDRYYSSDAPAGDFAGLEVAAENPQVVFQPVMCQHCNNAPCETVCPVAATMHSTEGLNQMAYNRCFGTRYCANNCPFKVRRFNWFSYPQNADKFPTNPANSDLGRMVLNPDVTVRSRGVMEKCSMCIQRIQEGKLNAKKEGRRPVDGEIQVACAQSCPSQAIIFGDMNDEKSKISLALAAEEKERAYQMLSEINVKPSVSYLAKVRNNA
ncbi:prokaryotic molybdopterin-containing oxidoreductase family, iron-sulfur binding subunit [Flexibacter flexilis DSM 6793]|uniref:Prokaryotic molybdopterin-containing oxidoreductase family, iron-sulfur binding subunit n=1 Tax=Flexibacter flexilis DSM 6793 TaxID=927664 RepID=A0A1I1KR28_9BACT|nr:TAT-variant-translocated molybdopterin oxidoreductase [Flexibacter flexilis]SFC63181.1 prokaryotic molybdopterin-containing oxidoreductase family, iron-sulfur binding subunit [Flexibacter flexilis DSM 6793]